MKVSRFFVFLMVIFVIALVVYVFTTPSTKELELTGIIMGDRNSACSTKSRMARRLAATSLGAKGSHFHTSVKTGAAAK